MIIQILNKNGCVGPTFFLVGRNSQNVMIKIQVLEVVRKIGKIKMKIFP
jgi:hypothetical protein